MSGGESAQPPCERPRRGRPPGSVALTEEREQLILQFIRAGGWDHAAAEAAGVSLRTFRDWISRGEGTHASRSSTPKLRRFAQAVRTARAEARIGAEIRVYRDRPAQWLSHAARSTPEREGWTTPGPEPGPGTTETQAQPGNTLEERLAEFGREEAEQGTRAARAATGDCPDPACSCTYHRRRYQDAYDRYIRGSD